MFLNVFKLTAAIIPTYKKYCRVCLWCWYSNWIEMDAWFHLNIQFLWKVFFIRNKQFLKFHFTYINVLFVLYFNNNIGPTCAYWSKTRHRPTTVRQYFGLDWIHIVFVCIVIFNIGKINFLINRKHVTTSHVSRRHTRAKRICIYCITSWLGTCTSLRTTIKELQKSK